MSELIKDFNDYRSRMNDVILAKDNLVLKRFWSLDNQAMPMGRWMPRPKTCWASWHLWYCAAMTVSNTI